MTNESASSETAPVAIVDDIVAAYERLMHRFAGHRAPEFLGIPITMPQAKVLYLLSAEGDLHMADLVVRLGVSLSTVSGLVDRLVEQDLASRREDPSDRRQVVVGLTARGVEFLDRFRELGTRHLRELLADVPDADLRVVRRAFAILDQAAERSGARIPQPSPARKDPE